MNHISNLLNTESFSVNREELEHETTLDPRISNIINKLFVFFYSICRGFDKQYQDPRRLNIEKTQWIKAFTDLGFNTTEKIKIGIKRCRLESPINTPTIAQFVKWCTPSYEELNIPRLEDAYDEACRNSHFSNTEKKWTHQAVYHAYTMCSSYELANLTKKITFPIFERNYDITVKMMMRGESLKEITSLITHDEDFEKKNEISKGFEKCSNRITAMNEISKILGKKIDASAHNK